MKKLPRIEKHLEARFNSISPLKVDKHYSQKHSERPIAMFLSLDFTPFMTHLLTKHLAMGKALKKKQRRPTKGTNKKVESK